MIDTQNIEGANPAGLPPIPAVEHIHQRIYDAVSVEGAFRMDSWGSYCSTTRCRGGWAVSLAGEAGRDLESFYNTELAAMLIYRASGYEINPCRFYDSDDEALADMKALAEAEADQAA